MKERWPTMVAENMQEWRVLGRDVLAFAIALAITIAIAVTSISHG